jgi:hypothetical protein
VKEVGKKETKVGRDEMEWRRKIGGKGDDGKKVGR